jgi:hypothetical protein
MVLEHKGVDAVVVDSFHRIVLATNDEWAVRAENDDRRYFVLKVSDLHKQDNRGYFGPLAEQIPLEIDAFRTYLTRMDISEFDRYRAPQTEALRLQKQYSADTFSAWWATVKEDEQIILRGRDRYGETEEEVVVDFSSESTTGQQVASKGRVYEAYRQSCSATGERPLRPEQFGARLAELGVLSRRVRQPGGRVYVYDFINFVKT